MAASEPTTTKAVVKEPVSPSQLDQAQTLKAARALVKHIHAKKDTPSKPDLLKDEEDPNENAESIWLILSAKKFIISKVQLKPSAILLPHPFLTPENTTACLIVKDPQRLYKDFVTSSNLSGTITRVIGISKLRRKFKSFESLRQLCDSHNIFIADDRIVRMLPQILGKTFYKKPSKVPIPVLLKDNSPTTLQSSLTKALSSTYLHLNPSASTSIRVAMSSLGPEKIAENIVKVVGYLAEKKVPKGWNGIKSLHIKSPDSVALPIYLSPELYEETDILKPEDEEQNRLDKEKKLEDKKKKIIKKKEKRAARMKRKSLHGGETEEAKVDPEDTPAKKKQKIVEKVKEVEQIVEKSVEGLEEVENEEDLEKAMAPKKEGKEKSKKRKSDVTVEAEVAAVKANEPVSDTRDVKTPPAKKLKGTVTPDSPKISKKKRSKASKA